MKRFPAILVMVAMLLSSLFISVPTASAISLTTSLAGRPIKANTLDWCSGIAYGKIQGKMVLFTAYHCEDNGTYVRGTVVTNGQGLRLGTWDYSLTSKNYDLAWIKLDSGNWPPAPYVIYRGACDSGCYGGTSDYWTVNNKWGDPNYSCANLGTGRLVGENWRSSQTSVANYIQGYVTEDDWPNCSMLTNIGSHCPWKDSGAGLVTMSGEVVGIGHASTVDCGGTLIFNNFREAITRMDDYYVTVSPYAGAYLCTEAGGTSCS